jgi:hypothetical protein
LRSKLAELGCEGLVATDPRGGYRLNEHRPFMLGDAAPGDDALDAWLREHAPWPAEAAFEDG